MDELQLPVEVPQRAPQQLRAPVRILGAAELLADRRARILGRHQLAQLLQRYAEQVLEAPDLAQPFDVRLAVLAMRPRPPLTGRLEQPDLLVVADRPRGRAR